MKIKPNASPQELDSPFYKANEKFCLAFERFIASKQGKVRGKYNAWSFLIEGKITTPRLWNLLYEKATYSSGNIFLSSKYQNLLVLAEWSCKDFGTNETSLFIRRRKFSDLLNPSFSKLDNHNNYVMKLKEEKSKIISELLEALTPLFESEEIYTIECENNNLTVELRSEEHHFDIFNQLILLS